VRLGVQPHHVVAEPAGSRKQAVEGSDRLHGSGKRSNHPVADLVGCDERK